MAKVLHVDFELTGGWALPIIRAADANPALSAVHGRWRESELSDLALSVETRIGALSEIVVQVDEAVRALSGALPLGAELERYSPMERRPHGTAYTFGAPERRTSQRLLIALDAFVSQARSIFENLAAFYRLFVRDYFGEQLSTEGSYQFVAELFPEASDAKLLRDIRHEMRHGRAPWLSFLVVSNDPPRFELQLSFNWRPEAAVPDDFVTMTQLRSILQALRTATERLQQELVRRVQTWNPQ